MEHIWWDYTYDPVANEVTVRRWRQRGNLRAEVTYCCDRLTWDEAIDVLDADARSFLLAVCWR